MITPSHRSNNFDLIRLLAALQVVLSHALGPHTGIVAALPENIRPFADTFITYLTWLPGVPVFFFISGFLIARSYERCGGDVAGYAWRRTLRIFPALWACLAVTLIALAFYGFLSADFIRSMTFPAWLAGQLTFVQFFNPEHFREFGTGVANGALWTITVELQFYFFIPLLYKTLFGAWRRKSISDMAFTAVIAGSFALWCAMDMRLNGPGGYTTAPMIWKLVFVTLLPHLWMFCLGILLHRHFETVRKWVEGKALIYLALYFGAMWLQHTLLDEGSLPFYLGYFPSRVILAFATISAAYSFRPLSGYLLRGTDISYGVYIYHSVVINVLIEAHLTQSPWALCWVLGISIILALLSWTLIEKPALSCKAILPQLPWLRRRIEQENASK